MSARCCSCRRCTTIRKLVLPSALPLIFTGLRLSLGVGWMVLIAAEMLAQNPGLGKFVWDEFQNGSSQSLARIMVAVLTIGIIGFLLDRVMFALQTRLHLLGQPVGSARMTIPFSNSPASPSPYGEGATAHRCSQGRQSQGRAKASSSPFSASPDRARRR